jgi:hypothetical protein
MTTPTLQVCPLRPRAVERALSLAPLPLPAVVGAVITTGITTPVTPGGPPPQSGGLGQGAPGDNLRRVHVARRQSQVQRSIPQGACERHSRQVIAGEFEPDDATLRVSRPAQQSRSPARRHTSGGESGATRGWVAPGYGTPHFSSTSLINGKGDNSSAEHLTNSLPSMVSNKQLQSRWLADPEPDVA